MQIDLPDGERIECWQCAGEGVVYSCQDDIGCIDPESGCDYCERRCDICKGKGGWYADEPSEKRDGDKGGGDVA